MLNTPSYLFAIKSKVHLNLKEGKFPAEPYYVITLARGWYLIPSYLQILQTQEVFSVGSATLKRLKMIGGGRWGGEGGR